MLRRSPAALVLLSFCALLSPAQDTQTAPTHPVSTARTDVSANAYVQFINGANGNGIREGTNQAGGALLSVRQSWKTLLGYDISYSYSRYTEHYYAAAYNIHTNVNELTASYLIQAPHPYAGFEPFATIGFGMLAFSKIGQTGTLPTLQRPATEFAPAFVYGVGVNRSLVSPHLGLRLQFRSVTSRVPDFHEDILDLHRLRASLQPTVGLYYRF